MMMPRDKMLAQILTAASLSVTPIRQVPPSYPTRPASACLPFAICRVTNCRSAAIETLTPSATLPRFGKKE